MHREVLVEVFFHFFVVHRHPLAQSDRGLTLVQFLALPLFELFSGFVRFDVVSKEVDEQEDAVN